MSHLIAMTKQGEVLGVHPDLVDDHRRLGWDLLGAAVAARQSSHAARDPLDHDGDGRKGGALKPADDSGDLASLRAEYTTMVGKRPFNGWDAATLRKKISEA